MTCQCCQHAVPVVANPPSLSFQMFEVHTCGQTPHRMRNVQLRHTCFSVFPGVQDGSMFKAQIPYAPYFYLQVKVGCNMSKSKLTAVRQHGARGRRSSSCCQHAAGAAVSMLQGLLAPAAVQGSM